MAESDHERIADELDEQSAKLERHTRELQEDVERARSDWERKRADPSVPGAPTPEEPDDAGAAQSGEAGIRAGGRPAGEEEPSEQQTPPQ